MKKILTTHQKEVVENFYLVLKANEPVKKPISQYT